MNNNRSGAIGLVGLIGCIALFFVLRRFVPFLSTLLLIIGGVVLALIVLLVVLVIVFSRKGEKTGREGNQIQKTASSDRAQLIELRRLTVRIRHAEIHEAGNRICNSVDSILRTLKENPKDNSSVRRFRNYYLPTVIKILSKYLTIEESGIPAEETALSTLSCLKEVQVALQKFHESLYDGEKMDLSVEMKVLKTMCKRDGLLPDEAFSDSDEEEETASTSTFGD